jgi:ATP-dependent Lon protease
VSKALEPSQEPVKKETELHVPQERFTDIQTGYPERTAEIQRLGRQVNHLNQEISEKIISLPTRATPTQPFNADSFNTAFNTHQHNTRVKNRILETLLRNRALGNTATPPIFCLVGAPGVGKTTIASSVARALGREFQAIALGGNGDSHTIKGWARSYQSPQAGEIINALIKSGVTNPVILLDEIDKLCETNTGNPAATLLEVLDPAQNNRFKDAYINIPVDLSQVFFIATANDWDAIPEALQSRLTRIDLASYTPAEKAGIATTFRISALFAAAINETDFRTELTNEFDNAPGGVRRTRQLMEQADGFYLRLHLENEHITYDAFRDQFFAHLRQEQAAAQQ